MEPLWVLTLVLLLRGAMCSVEQNATGCQQWESEGMEYCCKRCRPGNRVVKYCGLDPSTLCTPCQPGKYTEGGLDDRCKRCTQCVGAHVLLKECTISSDTQCGCKEGHTCVDDKCSACALTCGKGQEPQKRSCRPCPNGTFNDQIHQKCKPWSKQCPEPDQIIQVLGTAFSDIKCVNQTVATSRKPSDPQEDAAPVLLYIVTFFFVMLVLSALFIAMAAKRVFGKQKTQKTQAKKHPIVRTPTDDPRTLIAIECSFHEAEQEQGSSSESLDSKDSEDPLVP